MPTELAKKYFNTVWPVELYKFTSFLCSMILWPFLFYTEPKFFSHAHFVSLFLVGNAYFYIHTAGRFEFFREGPYYPLYFLFQVISLVGMSYAHQVNDYIYLAFIPCIMAMYFFAVLQDGLESFHQKKSLFLYGFGFCGLLIFEGFKKGEYIDLGELIALSAFCLWAFSTAIWGFELYFSNKNSKHKKSNQTDKKEQNYDKMFFHDMINHTHAVMLYLKTRRNSGSMNTQQMNNIINEMSLLQSSLQSHFGFKHKNLSKGNIVVPFQMAMARFYNLIDSYFPNAKSANIELKGLLTDEQSFEVLRNCTVEIISFHRVMTNILKNAFEAGSDEISCSFDYQEDGLHVVIVNNLPKLARDKFSLEDDLGQVISMIDNKKVESIGLESIAQICKEVGGEYKFQVSNGNWHSEVYFPSENYRSDSKKVA